MAATAHKVCIVLPLSDSAEAGSESASEAARGTAGSAAISFRSSEEAESPNFAVEMSEALPDAAMAPGWGITADNLLVVLYLQPVNGGGPAVEMNSRFTVQAESASSTCSLKEGGWLTTTAIGG